RDRRAREAGAEVRRCPPHHTQPGLRLCAGIGGAGQHRRGLPEIEERSGSSAATARGIRVMKLAFSTNAYTRFGLLEAIEGSARAGFAGVEILADVPHAYPDAIDDALIASIRRSLDKPGLAVSSINCNCSFGY